MPARKKQSSTFLGSAQLHSLLSSLNFLTNFDKSFKSRRQILRTIKAKSDRNRRFGEKVADSLTKIFGSNSFLFLNLAWFSTWILINTGMVPSIAAFDPFPFGLLTTVVSLEAIILAIVVLISQNRAGKVNDLRDETGLQVDLISEGEITKIIQLLLLLLKQNGIDVEKDKQLKEMLTPINTDEIEKALSKEVDQ